MLSKDLKGPYWLLRGMYGAVPIVAGVDKFTNVLTDWEQYLHPAVARRVKPSRFMKAVGLVEIAAGSVVLSKKTRVGAWLVGAWLVGIAVNLLTTRKHLDVAVRDLVMAGGAFTLAKLEQVRGASPTAEIAEQARQVQHEQLVH